LCQNKDYIIYFEHVIFLHLPIGETCFRQGELLYIHYKTFSFFICFLESQVREATASVRRTQLAVVRRKSTVVTQFKILNLNSRYRYNSAPNVKVLAARLGTKGWGWQTWGVGNSASGNTAGAKRSLGRMVEGG
jgi:hypothetical protein